MLRVLVAREISERKACTAAATAAEFNHMSDIGSGNGAVGTPAPFDAAGFLNQWFLTEDIEEAQWRAFRASATVYVNTALPYDLHVLKVRQESLNPGMVLVHQYCSFIIQMHVRVSKLTCCSQPPEMMSVVFVPRVGTLSYLCLKISIPPCASFLKWNTFCYLTFQPMAEPLLRSIKPPYSHAKGNGNCSSSSSIHGGDGCRSPTYALARAVLRLLGSCEALHAPCLPLSSVLAGLIERNSWP